MEWPHFDGGRERKLPWSTVCVLINNNLHDLGFSNALLCVCAEDKWWKH